MGGDNIYKFLTQVRRKLKHVTNAGGRKKFCFHKALKAQEGPILVGLGSPKGTTVPGKKHEEKCWKVKTP